MKKALVMLGMALAVVLASSDPAAADGTVNGVVRDATEVGIEGIEVHVVDDVWGFLVASTVTGPSGAYSVAVPPDTYRLWFHDPTGVLSDRFSGDVGAWPDSSPITVPESGTHTEDVHLHIEAGTVAGTITTTTPGPAAGIEVTAYDSVFGVPLASGSPSATDGSYSLVLAPGVYRLGFHDPTGTWGDRFSGDSPTWEASAVVTVVDGVTIAEDLVLHAPFAHIDGTVSGSASEALPGIYVATLDGYGNVTGLAQTDGDGHYDLPAVPPGDLTLAFYDPTGDHPVTWWQGQLRSTDATVVFLDGGDAATYDQQLGDAGHVSGTVTVGTRPIGGIAVVVVDAVTGQARALVTTSATGTFSAPGLPIGTYKVAYLDPTLVDGNTTTSFRTVVHPDLDVIALGTAAALTEGTPVTVTAGATTVVPNQNLSGAACDPTLIHPGADLTGHDFTGQFLQGCDFAATNLTNATFTGADARNAHFAGATLTGTILTGPVVSVFFPNHGPTDFRDVTGLTGAQLKAAHRDWGGLKLAGTGVDLSGQFTGFNDRNLDDADLSGLAFRGNFILSAKRADLRGTDLSLCACYWADLSGADLRGGKLTGAALLLQHMTFAGLPTEANLSGVKVAGADLRNISFSNGTDPRFPSSQLARLASDWTGTDLRGSRSVIRYPTDLSGPPNPLPPDALDLSFVTPSYQLAGAKFDRDWFMRPTCVMIPWCSYAYPWTSTSFILAADLSGMDLTDTELNASYLVRTNLVNANLADLDLSDVRFAFADLTGADLTAATIAGARFESTVGLTAAQLTATNPDWTGTWLTGGVDLAGTDFTAGPGYTLTGSNLSGADLSGADLTGVDLSGADLSGADLTGADLSSATLAATVIAGADLTDATGLSKTQIQATNHDWAGTALKGTGLVLNTTNYATGGYTLTGADLTGLNLTWSAMTGLDLTGTVITGANLTGTSLAVGQVAATHPNWTGTNLNLTTIDFSGFDFSGRTVTGARFTGLNLSGANLASTAITGAYFNSCNLSGASIATFDADFSSANLNGVDMTGKSVTGATLTNATGLTAAEILTALPNWSSIKLSGTGLDFSGADFTTLPGRTFTSANMAGLNLSGANLSGVNLAGVLWSSVNLTGADLSGATISGTLTNAVITGADLSGASASPNSLMATNHDWTGTNFSGMSASLAGRNLSTYTLVGVNLAGVNLTGAVVTGNDLSGASLAGASLANADFLGATGAPAGGATAAYATTRCPDGAVTDGGAVPTCVGHGFSA